MMVEPDNVRYCKFCKCQTWHCGEVCEWSDFHMKKSKVYPENPESWFPVLLKYEDQDEPCKVNSPYDIRDEVGFKVLKVRVRSDDD